MTDMGYCRVAFAIENDCEKQIRIYVFQHCPLNVQLICICMQYCGGVYVPHQAVGGNWRNKLD